MGMPAEQSRILELGRQVAMLTREVRRLQRTGGSSTAIRLTELETMLAAALAELRRASSSSSSGGSSGGGSDGGGTDPGTVPGPVAVPTGLTLRTGMTAATSWIDISWTAAGTDEVVAYEVLVERSGAASQVIESVATSIRVEPVEPGQRYTVSVCSLTVARRRSTYITGSVVAARDDTAPGPVTGIIAGAGLRTVTVSWNDNPEDDVRGGVGRYQVQLSTSPTPSAG